MATLNTSVFSVTASVFLPPFTEFKFEMVLVFRCTPLRKNSIFLLYVIRYVFRSTIVSVSICVHDFNP